MTALRTSLRLESLDERVVPSVAILVPPLPGPAVVTQAVHHHPLHGSGSGSYTGNGLIVDAGITDHFTGTVNLDQRGTFAVTGSISGVGMIPHGHAHGELVLTGKHGTITVDLEGPLQSGFSPLPGHFHYTIVGGTGAYSHLSGTGRVTLTTVPYLMPLDPVPPDMPIDPIPPIPVPRGEFTIQFS